MIKRVSDAFFYLFLVMAVGVCFVIAEMYQLRGECNALENKTVRFEDEVSMIDLKQHYSPDRSGKLTNFSMVFEYHLNSVLCTRLCMSFTSFTLILGMQSHVVPVIVHAPYILPHQPKISL